MAANRIHPPRTKALAIKGGEIGTYLWAKLMGQLTAEQRDMLLTARTLHRLSDALHQDEPTKLHHVPETNLDHARIAAELRHGEQLLTGTDWRKVNHEDRARMGAAVLMSTLTDE